MVRHPLVVPRLLARLLAVGCVGALSGAWAAPQAPGPAFPQFTSPAALKSACDAGLRQSRQGLERLVRRPADTGWLAAHDAWAAQVEDASSNLVFLSAVHPDKALRSASEACELRWNSFFSSVGQDARLARSLKRVPAGDAVDQALAQRLAEGFEDAGVDLPPAKRREAKRLNDRIGALGQAFDRNIRDQARKLAFTEESLAGVPPAVWQQAPRDAQGRRLLDTSYPVYFPLLQTATSEATRERMWRAKVNEGGPANLKLLAEIADLRRQYARLLGASSWADFVLRRRMAATPAQAQAFLDQVKQAVQQREREEVAQLRQDKAEHTGRPLAETQLARWDLLYYTERARQAKFAVDQEAFRKYFPPEQSLAFALRLVERLMGVRYQRVPDAVAWHPEVHTYAVSDAASGRALGTLWVDLYPREGKYNHAAVWGLRGSAQAGQRASQAAFVVNLDRKGLSLEELETVLHELGHAVHGNLSATRYSQQAGTSVPRDFVEAPSQMLEDWVYDPAVQKLFAEVCPTCEPVPAALLAQARAARDHGKGVDTARQHLYASYDLALYGPEPQDPLALWQRMEGSTPLGHVAGTMFPAGFSHIATNYSAGYYGYLWSLVVATDLRSAFAHNRLDPAVGLRYRNTILAQGSQRPPAQMVRDFLGRDFKPDAFFEDLKR